MDLKIKIDLSEDEEQINPENINEKEKKQKSSKKKPNNSKKKKPNIIQINEEQNENIIHI